jgi:hypothetical protein
MTIAQKRRFALIKNTAAEELEPDSLVMRERQLWDLVGDRGISDKETVRFAMNTIYQVAGMMLEGERRQALILRVELLGLLSDDRRYQRLVSTLIQAIRSGDRSALVAAQLTALCAVLMMSPRQHVWPREWDSPTYKTNAVWRPEKISPSRTRRVPRSSQAKSRPRKKLAIIA